MAARHCCTWCRQAHAVPHAAVKAAKQQHAGLFNKRRGQAHCGGGLCASQQHKGVCSGRRRAVVAATLQLPQCSAVSALQHTAHKWLWWPPDCSLQASACICSCTGSPAVAAMRGQCAGWQGAMLESALMWPPALSGAPAQSELRPCAEVSGTGPPHLMSSTSCPSLVKVREMKSISCSSAMLRIAATSCSLSRGRSA